ncbi:MAG: hypothetical protein H0T76_15360 [Nannocystis sp.]|nr:hypothetical protein [Nannocystis sp.]MBA3547860.1 hypothetical protein [Nannocystis sp.]
MITTDDKVEIAATLLGSFILGASFAKEFLVHGKFEVRVFLLGVSCLVLFVVIALIAGIRVRVFDRARPVLSIGWAVVFTAGNVAALDLFSQQFLAARLDGDIELEAMIFLVCYGLSTNLLFSLNRVVLFEALRQKTIYKYILAPINGLSGGAIVAGFIVWASR